MNCIFCKIVSEEIPCNKVFENDSVLAFYDVNPVTPEHILLIPKKHIASVDNIELSDKNISAEIFAAVGEIAKLKNLSEDGYRLIVNNGKAAGQEVLHLHVHILGGKKNLGPMIMD